MSPAAAEHPELNQIQDRLSGPFTATVFSKDGFSYTATGTDTVVITAIEKDGAETALHYDSGTLTIPNTVLNGSNTYKVTEMDGELLDSGLKSGMTALVTNANLQRINDWGAFYPTSRLASVDLSASAGLIWLGSGAFGGGAALRTISIPASVETLNQSFYNTKLSSITFEGSATKLPHTVSQPRIDVYNPSRTPLTGHVDLRVSDGVPAGTYTVVDGNPSDDTPFHGMKYTSAGTEYFLYVYDNNTPSDTSDDVYSASIVKGVAGTIPSEATLDGQDYPVEVIFENAYEGLAFSGSITIPDSVKFIDAAAFKGTTGVTGVTFPDGCDVAVDSFAGSNFTPVPEDAFIAPY